MIRAILFDLDGTLVQSEQLKALSYAMAVQRLRGLRRSDGPGPLEPIRQLLVGDTSRRARAGRAGSVGQGSEQLG